MYCIPPHPSHLLILSFTYLLIYFVICETRSHTVAQAGIEILTIFLLNLLSTGIPGVSHTMPNSLCFVLLRSELRAFAYYASILLLEVCSQSLVFAFEARSELPVLISNLQSSPLSQERSWDSRCGPYQPRLCPA